MILRLAVLTILLALFAVSFSAIVEYDGRSANAWPQQPSAGCYDQGAVCAPQRVD
ncbi:hypothetical protein [Aureimonas mangrovi]|uniref:hypothetical protein n=1 Tax=Aureimonas mangrovi TaxID=2758041 RepID=UPI00163DD4F9|nr:hypothetical protein [Aureimonas mangrovi]